MNKPLILSVKETEEKIIKIINESGIPAFILKNSIEKIYNQLLSLEQQELKNAREIFDKKKEEGEKK